MNFSNHENSENLAFSRVFPFLPNFREVSFFIGRGAPENWGGSGTFLR